MGERQNLIDKGAVGEFVAHLIDENGAPCDVELNQRLLALTPNEVSKIPKTIGIAAGEDKVQPVVCVLNGRHLSSLVVDEATASAALKLKSKAE